MHHCTTGITPGFVVLCALETRMSSPLNVTDSVDWAYPAQALNKYYYRKVGARGDRVTPLPYQTFMAQGHGHRTDMRVPGTWLTTSAVNTNSLYEYTRHGGVPPAMRPVVNQAYERFKEKAIGENASIGVFAAEMQESLGMIQNRALTMYKAARALRKGDLGDMASHLGVRVKRKHKGFKPRPENAAETWLEYWFGWSPFINDFYSVGEVMTQPVPGGKYAGTAKSPWYLSGESRVWKIHGSGSFVAKVGGEVYLENPNQFLMQQLGLVNPAQVVWELIPFSFLVDWVTDFGSFLGSYSDFFGCSVRNAYYTTLLQFHDEHREKSPFVSGVSEVTGYAMYRKTGLYRPMPNTQITANLGQSLTRTATAVSLLTTTLASMAGRPK